MTPAQCTDHAWACSRAPPPIYYSRLQKETGRLICSQNPEDQSAQASRRSHRKVGLSARRLTNCTLNAYTNCPVASAQPAVANSRAGLQRGAGAPQRPRRDKWRRGRHTPAAPQPCAPAPCHQLLLWPIGSMHAAFIDTLRVVTTRRRLHTMVEASIVQHRSERMADRGPRLLWPVADTVLEMSVEVVRRGTLNKCRGRRGQAQL